jgi:hypothetical protein
MITTDEQQIAERYLQHPAHEMRQPRKQLRLANLCDGPIGIVDTIRQATGRATVR